MLVEILRNPSGTVDGNYICAVGELLPDLVKKLGLDADDEKVAAILRGLLASHNAGELHNAALNLKDLNRGDERSNKQRLLDLRIINERTVAQVLPTQASSLPN